jgi:hypothetical protein
METVSAGFSVTFSWDFSCFSCAFSAAAFSRIARSEIPFAFTPGPRVLPISADVSGVLSDGFSAALASALASALTSSLVASGAAFGSTVETTDATGALGPGLLTM